MGRINAMVFVLGKTAAHFASRNKLESDSVISHCVVSATPTVLLVKHTGCGGRDGRFGSKVGQIGPQI